MSLGDSIGSSLGRAIGAALSGGSWSPLSLFQAGEQGLVYDAMDLSSFWPVLDSYPSNNNVTPNTTCGYWTDARSVRSTMQGPLAQFTFTAQGSTAPTTNSAATFLGTPCVSATFPTGGSGYAFSRAVGPNATLPLGAQGRYSQRVALSRALTGGEQIAVYSTGVVGSSLRYFTSADAASSWIACANNTLNVGAGGSTYLAVFINSALSSPITVYVTDYLAEKVVGNHAYQSTDANRPILRGTPTGANAVTNGDMASDARRNLRAYTQAFDNAAWTKVGTIVVNAVAAPDGTLTADKLVERAAIDGLSGHYVNQSPALQESTTYSSSCYAKSAGREWIVLQERSRDGTWQLAYFNISAGIVGTTSPGVTANITAVADSWYRCAMVFESMSGAVGNNGAILLASADGVPNYVGDGTSGVYLWGAQLEAATATTDYQRVDATLWNAYWTAANTTVEVAANVATWTASSSTLTHTLAATSGRVYRVRYTMTRSAGTLTPSFGGVTMTARSASGTYEEWITASSTAALVFTAAAFTGTLDDVAIHDCSADVVSAPYGLQMGTIAGVDRWMQTAAVDFTATDAMTVCMGARKFSDAAQGCIAELTASVAANNGAWLLAAPDAATATFAFDSKGTAQVDAVVSGNTAPKAAVLTGLADVSADTCSLRVNGVLGDTDVGDQGTGNYSAAALYFGRRAGTSLPFQGIWYGGVIRGALTSAELPSLEQWVSARTPETAL